jgi:hypothetical protein
VRCKANCRMKCQVGGDLDEASRLGELAEERRTPTAATYRWESGLLACLCGVTRASIITHQDGPLPDISSELQPAQLCAFQASSHVYIAWGKGRRGQDTPAASGRPRGYTRGEYRMTISSLGCCVLHCSGAAGAPAVVPSSEHSMDVLPARRNDSESEVWNAAQPG